MQAVAINTPLSQCHAWLGAIQCSVPNTQTRCTLSWTAGDRQARREGTREGGEGGREQEEGGREVGREEGGREQEDGGREGTRKGEREGESKGGSEEAMMLGRQIAAVEEGGLREGGGLMKGSSEEGTGRGMDGGREGASGGRETSREVS